MECKKAFTLLELSIVITAISFLIGAGFTTRAIVHRAQMNRIIIEKQKLISNIAIFYSQFAKLPGKIEQNECMSSSILNQHIINASGNLTTNLDLCNNLEANHTNFNDFLPATCDPLYYHCTENQKILASGWKIWSNNTLIYGTKISQDIYGMRMLFLLYEDMQIKNIVSPVFNKTYISYNDVENFFIQSKSYSNNFWTLSTSELFRGGRMELEVFNSKLRNNFYNKNQVSIFYNVADQCGDNNGIGCLYGLGAVPVKIAYLIDQKIDDGKPYTGNVVSFKPSLVQNINNPNMIEENICTNISEISNQTINSTITDITLDNAEYVDNINVNTLNRTYGCNMSFKMEI